MERTRDRTPRHPIRVVSRRTGLSPALLRAWEKRYGVVTPGRTEGGQRLYTDQDIQRLSLLKRVVEEGRSIGSVAHLSLEELRDLVEGGEGWSNGAGRPPPLEGASPVDVLRQAMEAVAGMEPERLEKILSRAAMAFSVPVVLEEVVVPLLARIGAWWEGGRFGPAHEHVATVVIRRFLEWLLETIRVASPSPVLVAATPAGERHELGALLAAVSAAAEGWTAYYLGPDLPAGEIARAAGKLRARVVALSCVDEGTVGRLGEELERLRAGLAKDVVVLVGGGRVLAEKGDGVPAPEGVEKLGSLGELRKRLRELGGR